MTARASGLILLLTIAVLQIFYRQVAADIGWSAWSAWSACSRTCGGGVRSRMRTCNQNYDSIAEVRNSGCHGQAIGYHICNEQSCPKGEPNFREVQCSRYNGRSIHGRTVHQWLPSSAGSNNCELACEAVGFGWVYSFGKVTDGTKCTNTEDICVNGRCMRLGCDGNLDSDVHYDLCGVCGGRNDTCQQVRAEARSTDRSSGIFGYSDVTVIPVGATNIKISENGSSYLAIMDNQKHFIINGHMLLDQPGVFSAAGTSLIYNRTYDNQETLTAIGPINKELRLMLLQRDPEPKVSYEYWISKDKAPSFTTTTKATTTTTTTTVAPWITQPTHFYPRWHSSPSGWNRPVYPSAPSYPSGRSFTPTTPRPTVFTRPRYYPSHHNITTPFPTLRPSWAQHPAQPGIPSDRSRDPGSRHQGIPYSTTQSTFIRQTQYITTYRPFVAPFTRAPYSRPSAWPSRPTTSSPVIQAHPSGPPRSHSGGKGRKKTKEKKGGSRKLPFPLKPVKPGTGSCPLCPKVNDRVKNFCRSEFVFRALVTGCEMFNGETRYELLIVQSYKNTVPILNREYLWVPSICRCPRLRVGKEYIIMGSTDQALRRREVRLLVDNHSYVRPYSNEGISKIMHLRRYQAKMCKKQHSSDFRGKS